MRITSVSGLVVFGALGLVIHTGAAGLDYVESIDGDLSGAEDAPTFIALELGANIISGQTNGLPQEANDPELDRDFFTITVGPGQTLESLVMTQYVQGNPNTFAFMAVDDRVGFETLDDAAGYIGNALLFPDDALGEDILPILGEAQFDGVGFDGPLGEGDYTFWYQEVTGNTTYSFTANLVPEPGSAVALLLGIGGLMARRRR